MTTSKSLPHRSQLSACRYRNEPLPVSALIKPSPSIGPNRVMLSVHIFRCCMLQACFLVQFETFPFPKVSSARGVKK